MQIKIRGSTRLVGIVALLFLLVSTVLTAQASTTVTVTPTNPNGWNATATGAGSVGITSTLPRSGNGSLQFTGDATSRFRYRLYWDPALFPSRTLGNLTALSYDWYRSSTSSNPAVQQAAFQLAYIDGTQSGYLTWEAAYNGYVASVPTDTWISSDIFAGNFWMRAFSPGRSIDDYNVSLAEWIAGADEEGSPIDDDADTDVAHVLSANTIIYGIEIAVGSGWNGSHQNFVDNVSFSFGASDSFTYNFEIDQCTTVCYASPTGSDANSGLTPATAKRTIQAAIDAVSAGGTVRVLPGTYSETASDRYLSTDGSGPYQFGLFFDVSKPGITVQGVTATDDDITSASGVLATINTNATNGFGPSGIFVDAADITIAGVEIGTNSAGLNKTIEVIGDGFSLINSVVNDPEGTVYINDFTTTGDRVQSYLIDGNVFVEGVSVDLASGAGLTGPVSGRVITNNSFTNSVGQFWPFISFNGSGTGVPWFVNSVGGAVITGNTFNHTDNSVDQQFIRARGTYDNSQFDWQSYWNNNDYNKSTVALEGASGFNVRSYSYASAPYTFNDVRRIGGQIQPEVGHAVNGDRVLVNSDTLNNGDALYPEYVNLNKEVTVLGPQANVLALGRSGNEAIVTFPTGYTGSNPVFDINANNVTINGFTIGRTGDGASAPWLIRSITAGRVDGSELLYNLFEGNPGVNSFPGGAYLLNQDNTVIEANYFNDLGQHAVFMAGSSSNAIYRNNDSYGNYNSNFSMHDTGVGHSNVLIENNRAIEDSLVLFNVKGATIQNNSFTGSATVGSRIFMGGGHDDIIITGNTLTNPRSAAVLVYDGGFGYGANSDVTVSSNTITQNVGFYTVNNTVMIDVRDTTGAVSITGNSITFSGTFVSPVDATHGINLRNAVGVVTVTSNTLNGGNVDSSNSSPSIGLRLLDNLSGTSVTATLNVINGFTDAVRVVDSASDGVSLAIPTSINRNDLAANAVNGIANGASGTEIAGECNWYGSASGPSGVGPGTGTAVTSNIDFIPWLTVATPLNTAPCNGVLVQPVANNDTASVTDNVLTLIPVLGNDTYTGTPTIMIISPPTNGVANATAGGIEYTGTDGYNGGDSLTYQITDANGVSNIATVTITVNDCQTVCYANPVTGSDSNDGTTPATAKLTVQAAVDDVNAGGTVIMAAGSFTEQVVIGKSIVLEGAGQAATFINSPSPMSITLEGSQSIVYVNNGADVDMSDFAIDGTIVGATGGCADDVIGLYVYGAANAELNGVTISDIRLADNALLGCQTGVAVVVGSSTTTGTVRLENSTISGYQKGGIAAYNAGSNVILLNTTVTGIGATPAIAQNGVQISDGATASIMSSTISGNVCDNPACGPNPLLNYASVGLLVDFGGTVTVSNSTITGNDHGVWAYGSSTTIQDSDIVDNRYIGIIADEGTTILTANDITTTSGNAERGLMAVTYDGAAANTVVTATLNTISGFSIGISVEDENNGDAETNVLTANRNSIADDPANDEGYRNTTPVSHNVECNWWGDATGPSEIQAGNGAEFYGAGDFTPWLTAASPLISAPCDGGAFGSLQGTILLQSRLAPSSVMSVPVTVELYAVGGTTPLYTFAPTTDTNGVFTVTGIAPGTYVVWVKYERHLAVREMSVVITASNTTLVTFAQQLAGDANNDNFVDIGDLSVLGPTYDKGLGDVGYDARADFNGDDVTDLLDLSLIGANYEVGGAQRDGLP